nr:hypothetical protein [Tanacetum cinerariifolium]
MGNKELRTIPKKESDEVIKSNVEDFVPILSEPDDTSGSNSECDLPACYDFSPINVLEGKSESTIPLNEIISQIPSSIAIIPVLPIEDPDDSLIIGNKELRTIPKKESDEVIKSNVEDFVPILSEPDDTSGSNITPLSDSKEDGCSTPCDDVEFPLHHDLSTPIMSVVSIFEGFSNEPLLEENDDLFDLESKENEWKNILYDVIINDLITEDKVFDPGIHDQIFLQHM